MNNANPIDDIAQWFIEVANLLVMTGDTVATTCQRLKEINFTDNIIVEYLGYAKYAMGTPLYMLFTTVILISVGLAVYTYLVKGIGYLKNFLPW